MFIGDEETPSPVCPGAVSNANCFFKMLGLFMDWWEALIRYTALCKTRWSMHACGTVSAIQISKIT